MYPQNTTREDERSVRAANPEAFFPAGLIETGAHNIAMELADKRNLHALDRDVSVHASALFMMSSVICICSVAAMRWCCVYSVHAWRMTPLGSRLAPAERYACDER